MMNAPCSLKALLVAITVAVRLASNGIGAFTIPPTSPIRPFAVTSTSSPSKSSSSSSSSAIASTSTSLNLKVAKNLYPSSPLEINYVHDETGEKLHFGTTDSMFDKMRNLDYSLVTDEMVENIVTFIDEDKLLLYLEAFERKGRAPTGLVVVDVRDAEDVERTGKFTPHTFSFPYSKMREEHPFHTIDDDDDFYDQYGFDYVEAHERLIVVGDKETAKIAAKYLAFNSYIREILCYDGGAEEWFADLPPPS